MLLDQRQSFRRCVSGKADKEGEKQISGSFLARVVLLKSDCERDGEHERGTKWNRKWSRQLSRGSGSPIEDLLMLILYFTSLCCDRQALAGGVRWARNTGDMVQGTGVAPRRWLAGLEAAQQQHVWRCEKCRRRFMFKLVNKKRQSFELIWEAFTFFCIKK